MLSCPAMNFPKPEIVNVKASTTVTGATRYDWDEKPQVRSPWSGEIHLVHHTFIGPNPPEEVLDALSREQARRGEVHEGIEDDD